MKRDEFNDLHITNADGDESFNEDTLPTPENDQKQPDIEVTNEGAEEFHVDEYLEEAPEIEDVSLEENKIEENNNSDTSSSNLSSTSSAASSAATASATSAAASIGATIGAVVCSVGVVASLSLGIINLPTSISFNVELAKASTTSLSFTATTNAQEIDNIYAVLEGNDYQEYTPFSGYFKFEKLQAKQEYTLSIYYAEEVKYAASFFTTAIDNPDSILIHVFDQNEQGFDFSFSDESIDASRFHNVKVITNDGETIFADDTIEMSKSYHVPHNVDANILIYVNNNLEGATNVTKYDSGSSETTSTYDYDNIIYDWSEDGFSCTVTIPSLDSSIDSYVLENLSAEIIESTTPTCEVEGTQVTKVSFIGPNGLSYYDTKTINFPATDHNYGDPVYEWDEEYHCIAKRVCQNDPSHIDSEDGQIQYELLEPATCTDDGLGRYYAIFNNPIFQTQYNEVVIPATDHDYGEPEYVWANDYSTCTATRICANDSSHVESEVATASYEVVTEPTSSEPGLGRYTANFDNTAFETQTYEIELEPVVETQFEILNNWVDSFSGTDTTTTYSSTSSSGTTYELEIRGVNYDSDHNCIILEPSGANAALILNSTPTARPIKALEIVTSDLQYTQASYSITFSSSQLDANCTYDDVKYCLSGGSTFFYPTSDDAQYFNIGVTGDATFLKQIIIHYDDINITIDEENNLAYFGYYPTTLVEDTGIIEQLADKETIPAAAQIDTGLLCYENQLFVKLNATPASGATFNNGNAVTDGETYYFKATKLEWTILAVEDDTYVLLCNNVIDQYEFNSTEENTSNEEGLAYANNYAFSTLRNYVTRTIFKYLRCLSSNANSIVGTTFDISADLSIPSAMSNNLHSTIEDEPVCVPTYHQLYKDYSLTANQRKTPSTDYAIAKGVYSPSTFITGKGQYPVGNYWLSSPGSEATSNASMIDQTGNIYNKNVLQVDVGIRPIIRIRVF